MELRELVRFPVLSVLPLKWSEARKTSKHLVARSDVGPEWSCFGTHESPYTAWRSFAKVFC